MNKKSVEGAILKGSAKQRAILIANDIAEKNLGGSGLLTDDEISAIVASFKTERDILAYRKYRKIFDALNLYCTHLSGSQFRYSASIAKLEKFILIQDSNSDLEEVVNQLLDLIPKGDQRSKALEITKRCDNLILYRRFEIDEDDYIKVGQDRGLDEVILQARKTVIKEQLELKTSIEVFKDYVKETGFRVQQFTAFVKGVENYLRSIKNPVMERKKLRCKQSKQKIIQKIADRYCLEPNYDDIEIDRARYSKIWEEYLNV